MTSPKLNSDLVRICQEATANAVRHAHATELLIRLNSDDGKICLSVKDNGIGMDCAWIERPPTGHYGLLGMKERVQRFGGKLDVSSAPGTGTTVQAIVPIER